MAFYCFAKHIAQAAGLGTIGRHSLLITPEFGSMVWLGAVLCEQNLEPDKMKEPLCNNCNLCVDICPVNALENPEIKQQSCWDCHLEMMKKSRFGELLVISVETFVRII